VLALKVLSSLKVTSELVAECLDALSALASLNEVTLMWGLDTVAFLAMKKLINLPDKHQLCYYLVQSRLLEYLGVQQEKQLRTGPSINIILPANSYQVIDIANFLLVDHVREELKTCLN
jgi:hypothetical protein